MKPRIFIGSSSESLHIAEAVESNLKSDAEVLIWKKGIFKLSKFALDSLLELLNTIDYGIFIFSPDDLINFRGDLHESVRDNVIFELGLFIGRLGKDKCFILMPEGTKKIRIPTDLSGFTVGTYDIQKDNVNLVDAVNQSCDNIRQILKSKSDQEKIKELEIYKSLVGIYFEVIKDFDKEGRTFSIGAFRFDDIRKKYSFDGTNYRNTGQAYYDWTTKFIVPEFQTKKILHLIYQSSISGESSNAIDGYAQLFIKPVQSSVDPELMKWTIYGGYFKDLNQPGKQTEFTAYPVNEIIEDFDRLTYDQIAEKIQEIDKEKYIRFKSVLTLE